jgi:predicted amidohydrolase
MTDFAEHHDTLAAALSRRGLLGATLGAAAGAAGAAPAAAQGTASKTPVSVKPDGTYDTVPLEKDTLALGVMQLRVRPVDIRNVKQSRKANLDHMLASIDAAHGLLSRPKDILFFHEFPITGFSSAWSRQELHDKVAIDLPGEETEALAKKAKEYNTYIVFGSYARDKDWPGHVLSITTIMDNNGAILAKQWKARNIMGVFGQIELFTTTIYGALDRYTEMYGADAVIPVARTPRGNIATTSVQREPELIRAFAFKGAEICLRTATGGFTPWDIQANAAYNQMYTAVCNNAISPGATELGVLEDAGGGKSAIYGPRGDVIAEANSAFEQEIVGTIPIAQYRRTHRQPAVAWELYRPVYDKYVAQYPPSHFSKGPVDDLKAAKKLMDSVKRY